VLFVRQDGKKGRMEYIDDASSMGAVVNMYINFIGILNKKKNTLKV
jgi:hypothetical protein